MQFFKETDIDFIKLRKIALLISGSVIAVSIISLVLKGGPELGLDFTGGIEVHLKFNELTPISRIRASLSRIGLGSSVIQSYGRKDENLVLIRFGVEEISQNTASKIVPEVENTIKEEFKERRSVFIPQSTNLIGPKISEELRRAALLAVIFGLLGMLIYISWRFKLRFAVGAVAALAHDVFISVGALSLGNFEFNLPIIAALLTIIGYSLNDTIVIYDRIRENFKTYRKRRFSYKKVFNLSINQSLSRTIVTSLTTFVVVLALFLWGGPSIHGFAFTLLVGVIVGTYSSSFVATPVVYTWGESKTKKR
ncbi:MAG: protein translocase subunit SecF [Candidatus Aerophobetes bacterium]|nr:protein translocase subunit SecF [Candidatus Aerophobetes bacterium]